MAQHALLSPSASHRWLNCTAAPSLEKEMPDSSSIFAEEGTLAHAICEAKLKELIDGVSAEEHFKAEHDGKAWNEMDLYQTEMEDTSDYYRDIVAEKLHNMRQHTPDAELLIETAIDFSEWIPEGFGTADAIVVGDGELDIIDYKHGRGVPVYSENNPQMMTYALGACRLFDISYDIKKVTMTIVQPRIDNTSTWNIPYESLQQWGVEVLTPRAKEAFNGILGCPTTVKVGEWCRFCKAKAVCRERANAAVELLGYNNPKLLAPDEVGQLLERTAALKDWYSDLEAHALELMLNGTKVDGYKVVEGRSIRKIVKPVELVKILTDAGANPENIYRPQELRTLGDLEKMFGKKVFNELAGDCIEKPAGKPTIAKQADRRPEYNSVTSDFSHIINS